MSVFRQRQKPADEERAAPPKHRRRPVVTSPTGEFSVWWAATTVAIEDRRWPDIEAMLDEAMCLLPGGVLDVTSSATVIGGFYAFDSCSFCFFVKVRAGSNGLAQSLAYRALQEALQSAGVALGRRRLQTWTPLVIELDPSPLRLSPLDARRFFGQLSTS